MSQASYLETPHRKGLNNPPLHARSHSHSFVQRSFNLPQPVDRTPLEMTPISTDLTPFKRNTYRLSLQTSPGNGDKTRPSHSRSHSYSATPRPLTLLQTVAHPPLTPPRFSPSKRASHLPSPTLDSPSPTSKRYSLAHHQVFNQTSPVLEEQLHDNLIASLRSTRAKSGELSRHLREQELLNTSLKTELEEEHLTSTDLRNELARISSMNTTLIEHNRLLASRDSALQEDISTLMTQSYEHQMTNRKTLTIREPSCSCSTIQELPESQSYILPPPESPTISRSELVAAQDELFLIEQELRKSRERCAELTHQVDHLQDNLNTCMDESSRALEIERELRRDVEAKVHQLLSEMAEMRKERDALRDELHVTSPLAEAWKRKIGFVKNEDSSPTRRTVALKGRRSSRPLSFSGALQLSMLAEEDGDTSREHRRYHSQPFNALLESAPSLMETEVNPFDKMEFAESICSTAVTTPSITLQLASTLPPKQKTRMPGIWSATLSKSQSRALSPLLLKAESSVCVDMSAAQLAELIEDIPEPDPPKIFASHRSPTYLRRVSTYFFPT